MGIRVTYTQFAASPGPPAGILGLRIRGTFLKCLRAAIHSFGEYPARANGRGSTFKRVIESEGARPRSRAAAHARLWRFFNLEGHHRGKQESEGEGERKKGDDDQGHDRG